MTPLYAVSAHAAALHSPGLVLVIVIRMDGVPVALMRVVHVIVMGDCFVPAAVAVSMGVALVSHVGQSVLVVVALMRSVCVPVVDVVHMVRVLGAGVPAARPVAVLVLVMGVVPGTGHCSSLL